MGGFVLAYGKKDRNTVEKMFAKIPHRGDYLQGIHEQDQFVLAQNVLRADTYGAAADATIPVVDGVSVGYDGQIGNAPALSAELGVAAGPMLEERLLMKLYGDKGAGAAAALDDAIFSFAVCDGAKLLAARDVLGIKTLFYSKQDDVILLASELKALAAVTDDVHEFPAGHTMDETGVLTRFGALPDNAPAFTDKDVDQIKTDVRDIILRSIKSRVDFERPTGGLLSGGMDSSVINFLCSGMCREKFGQDAKLKTFAIGVGESTDIINARIMAEHIGSEHHELTVSLEDMLNVLPDVVYHLENFDPSLVRSSVSNYLISRFAHQEFGMEVLLSGEGGDEIFCGYAYLKKFPAEELPMKQIECLKYLHNNASLRLDRMNACHGVKGVAPLISGELLNYALAIPPQYKQRDQGNGTKIDKWIFRQTYAPDLPKVITERLKQEFSQGSGSADVLPDYFEEAVSDSDLEQTRKKHPIIRSKEELYYFRIFTEHFGEGAAVDTVGQWVLL